MGNVSKRAKKTKRCPHSTTDFSEADATAAGSLRAGVAKSDITTDAKDVAVNDPLYAKALVLDDGTTKLVIISMDAVAIGGICDVQDDFLPKLRSQIEKECKSFRKQRENDA